MDATRGVSAGDAAAIVAAQNEPPDGAPLTPGRQLGRYEVLHLLGAGGMGRVYRARDETLGREVAIKALAYAFRADSANLRRLEREARVLAALSHPNIASIYGFERHDGAPYLILEHVDGESLAERLRRGALSLRETQAIAVQVARGLEEAHSKGVIHRDLKPSNVMLSIGGRAKLVDFGLAKSAPPPDPRTPSPVADDPITAAGAVIGTAAYMSPEQIHGEEVDARTDVWSFGCLVFEMLAGRPVYRGRSMGEVLAAVLRDEPDWSALPPATPPAIHRLLRRCLRKDVAERLQHIGDARLELTEADSETHGGAPAAVPPLWRRVLPWGIAAIAAATALAAIAARRTPPAAPGSPLRLSLELPPDSPLGDGWASPFDIDPAGTTLVLQTRHGDATMLQVRSLDSTELRRLPGTEDAVQPFFSPDGRAIGFFANRRLSRASTDGSVVLPLVEVGGNPRGGTWAEDGTIVVAPSQSSGLMRLADQGGKLEALTTLDTAHGEYSHRWPMALPGGEWVLFTVGFEDAAFDEGRIEAVSLRTHERRQLLPNAGFARYAAGRLLFVREGRLQGVAFDLQKMQASGEPEMVVDAVRYDSRNGGTHLAVSRSGAMVYGPGAVVPGDYYLMWIDRAGVMRRVVDTPRPFRDPSLRPDGRKIAVVIGSSTDSDLWTLDDDGSNLSRISFGLAPHRPAYSPDGTRIAVSVAKDGKWRILSLAADGSGEPLTLYESENRVYPDAFTPDGRHLVFQEKRPETSWDLRLLGLDASGRTSGAPADISASRFDEASASISPDGRLIAFESDELDSVFQIYVRPLLAAMPKARASEGGGRVPEWNGNGKVVFWHTGPSRMRVVQVEERGGTLAALPSVPLWGTENAAPPGSERLFVASAAARFCIDHARDRVLAIERSGTGESPRYKSPVIVLGRK